MYVFWVIKKVFWWSEQLRQEWKTIMVATNGLWKFTPFQSVIERYLMDSYLEPKLIMHHRHCTIKCLSSEGDAFWIVHYFWRHNESYDVWNKHKREEGKPIYCTCAAASRITNGWTWKIWLIYKCQDSQRETWHGPPSVRSNIWRKEHIISREEDW